MRVAVVGGSGNVGSALLHRLAEDAATHLVGVSRRVPGPADAGRADWYPVDIASHDAVGDLTAAFTGADAVVHLAWRIQPSHDTAGLERVNLDGTRHVLAAVAAAAVPHLIVASSVGAYAPARKDVPVHESWPTTGIASSTYSRHKAQVETLLDGFERDHPDRVVSRLRPALVFQQRAASEIARYFLGPLVPRQVLGRLHLPGIPLPAQLVFQCVHADDLAEAFAIVLRTRAPGAFNVATDPPLTPPDLVRALGASRRLPLPLPVLRAVADLTWRARLQPTDAGWLDLAAGCPIMATDRIRDLGWEPRQAAVPALQELIDGIRDGAGDPRYPSLAPQRPLDSRRQG